MHYCIKNNTIKLFYIIFYKTEDWEWSVVLPIPKKGNTKECSNYCTTTLISYASKVMLKILQDRLQQYVNWELPNVQAGCRKGRRTRYQISNIHWITEKARELQKNINFCFIDYAKAFHCVDHNKLWKILKEMGIPENPTWSCETCMQVKKQELKPDTEQWTHSKYRKFYIKAVYHHPAYLTYTHNTPYRMPSWM